MVCTTNDLSAWKDFPKGLRVLLLNADTTSASQMKSKLEVMYYVVSLFSDENDALSAFSSKPESFHVAIVEVSSGNNDACFKFLEAAKDLPTIMTSNIYCLSTMMKCIALGAVEFLQKPVSDDKLRNIWQHVVHKAFDAGRSALSGSLKPIKDSVASILQINVKTERTNNENINRSPNGPMPHYDENEESPPSDKFPAPSTPQLNQGVRLLDDGDCQDHTNCSMEKDSGELEGESKSAETTCAMAESVHVVSHLQSCSDAVVREKNDSAVCVKSEKDCLAPQITNDRGDVSETRSKSSAPQKSGGMKTNRKKTKVDWTPELHKKFVLAVEQLGVDHAIPSRILEVMKVEGLTRHNVASHLQKYRMRQRHILPKEDDRKWMQHREQVRRSYYPYKSIMGYPACQSNSPISPAPFCSFWGGNSNHPPGVPVWAPPGYLPWTAAENWHWKTYKRMQADAWGCPIMPPPTQNYSFLPHAMPGVPGFLGARTAETGCAAPQNSLYHFPAEEVIDKVVKEAISKPWLPLPLGLKPPSTDSVLSELSRQGIFPVQHNKKGSNSW